MPVPSKPEEKGLRKPADKAQMVGSPFNPSFSKQPVSQQPIKGKSSLLGNGNPITSMASQKNQAEKSYNFIGGGMGNSAASNNFAPKSSLMGAKNEKNDGSMGHPSSIHHHPSAAQKNPLNNGIVYRTPANAGIPAKKPYGKI